MNWVKVNHLNVAYQWHGEGKETLVLLHGAMVDQRMWAYQLDALGQHYRLLTFDLRGHGHTQGGQQERTTIALLADDLHHLLDVLNVQNPTLLGLSLGGMVALTYTAKYAGVKALVAAGAAASSTLTLTDWVQTYSLGWSLAPTVRLLGAAGVTDLMFSTGRLLRGSKWVGANETVDQYVRNTMRGMSTEDVARTYDLLLRYRGSDWSRISAPTLLLVGEHESKSVHHHGRYLSEQIPHAEVQVIPGAGHVVNMEQPERFNQAVLNFLRSIK